MRYGPLQSLALALAVAGACATASPARAQQVRVAGLEDINFGMIPAAVDRTSSQDVAVCSYRNKPQTLNYSVTAIGSGSGGAFQLASGPATLPFDVQWADAPGQTGGTMLQAGVAATGFGNGANGFDCPALPDTASLTVTIRAADLASAAGGTYSGTLQITIVPE
jgi:hypothetical protein